jgi:hypothetical protein
MIILEDILYIDGVYVQHYGIFAVHVTSFETRLSWQQSSQLTTSCCSRSKFIENRVVKEVLTKKKFQQRKN